MKKPKFYSIERTEDCQRILKDKENTGYVRNVSLENAACLEQILNDKKTRLFVNYQGDNLDDVRTWLSPELDVFMSSLKNHISYSEEDSLINYENGYFYFFEIYQLNSDDTLVVFKYNH